MIASNRLLLKEMQNVDWYLESLALFVGLWLKNPRVEVKNCEMHSFYDPSL